MLSSTGPKYFELNFQLSISYNIPVVHRDVGILRVISRPVTLKRSIHTTVQSWLNLQQICTSFGLMIPTNGDLTVSDKVRPKRKRLEIKQLILLRWLRIILRLCCDFALRAGGWGGSGGQSTFSSAEHSQPLGFQTFAASPKLNSLFVCVWRRDLQSRKFGLKVQQKWCMHAEWLNEDLFCAADKASSSPWASPAWLTAVKRVRDTGDIDRQPEEFDSRLWSCLKQPPGLGLFLFTVVWSWYRRTWQQFSFFYLLLSEEALKKFSLIYRFLQPASGKRDVFKSQIIWQFQIWTLFCRSM